MTGRRATGCRITSYNVCYTKLLRVERLLAIDLAAELAAPEGLTLTSLLSELRSAAFALSDQLSLRFFSHVAEQWTGAE